MCRHFAYLGPPLALSTPTFEAPHSLERQSYAPKLQRHGTVNVDGFGLGWHLPERAEPVRYRRAQPIWTDASLASLAPSVAAGCMLGAVRSATAGFPAEESCAAPFSDGRRLFSHNGKVADYSLARSRLRDRVAEIPDAAAPVDSAFLFGLAAAGWRSGRSLGEGLVDAVRAVEACGGGRLNLLASDGSQLAAVRWGDDLHFRVDANAATIASEPLDADPNWREAPPKSLTTLRRTASHSIELAVEEL